MKATSRLGRVGVPGAAGLPLAQPAVVARSRSPRACAATRASGVGGRLGRRRLGAVRRHQSGTVDARLLAGAGAPAGGRRILSRRCGAARLSDGAVRNAATEIRRLAHDLQPAPVEDRGLEAALADYVATLDAPGMPRIRLHAAVAGSLPAAVEQGAYLVLEALNNVIRHAHAEQCEVTVTLASSELVLSVADDGVGLAQPYVSVVKSPRRQSSPHIPRWPCSC
jgi:hypothetical protein